MKINQKNCGKTVKTNQNILISFVVKRLLFTLLIFFTLNSNAQENRITLTMENVSLGDILQEIKKQSGKNILYNNTKVDIYQHESLKIKNATLDDVLKECLNNKDLQYRIMDDVIVIEPESHKENKSRSVDDQDQTIKGTVVDADIHIPLTGANIILLNTDPLMGTVSDANGYFRLEHVPLGRYDMEISFIGYKSYIAREVLVSSGRETVLNIALSGSSTHLEEIRVKAGSNKEEPINSMATLSAKQISMEEANRYAGGIDDPARLVTAAVGATFANVRSNGIVIRGNAPKGLLWRMEGIQIPNPSHFADFISLGGGALTALSSQTMANSDFYTGAFPAEFGNALSGVFDINLRSGNTEKREHTFQAGIIGIDFASEGPFIKGNRSSYLFNYRYSTLGLLAPILPKEMGVISYQDLSFKLNFPARKLGVFSLWGIGSFDKQLHNAEKDSLKWKSSDDRKEYLARFTMGAVGVSHKVILGEKTYLHTGFATTGNGFAWTQKRYNNELMLEPKTDFKDNKWKYTLTSEISHKFGAAHTNKTGLIFDRLNYDIVTKEAYEYGEPLQTYVSGKGSGELVQFYSQSKISISKNVQVNAGIHSQYFTLNNRKTIEPRIGVHWNVSPVNTVSVAYGLHSQLENLNLYFVQQQQGAEVINPNKDLDFAKAHHVVLGYYHKFSENLVFRMEPYFQKLFNIPVVPHSYFSTINIDNIWSFNDSLINTGTGKNYGIDISLERFLNKGFYYLISGSLFGSKYKGGDGIERNTRYNRNYVLNLLGGKEWMTGKSGKNLFSANIRFSYLGGERVTPVYLQGDEVIEESTKAYSVKLPDAPILSFAFSYRINKPAYSGVWSLQIVNALAHKEFQEYRYDAETDRIVESKDLIIIPNIAYKIEF